MIINGGFNSAIFGLSIYIEVGQDRLTKTVRNHKATKAKYSLIAMAKGIKSEKLPV